MKCSSCGTSNFVEINKKQTGGDSRLDRKSGLLVCSKCDPVMASLVLLDDGFEIGIKSMSNPKKGKSTDFYNLFISDVYLNDISYHNIPVIEIGYNERLLFVNGVIIEEKNHGLYIIKKEISKELVLMRIFLRLKSALECYGEASFWGDLEFYHATNKNTMDLTIDKSGMLKGGSIAKQNLILSPEESAVVHFIKYGRS